MLEDSKSSCDPMTGHKPLATLRRNTVDAHTFGRALGERAVRLTLSSRAILPQMSGLHYIRTYFLQAAVCLNKIESLFGSTQWPSPLYGGRSYQPENSLTEEHIRTLRRAGIGVSLTLTNHFFSEAAYGDTLPLLQRLHVTGNAVTCVSDSLAERIRRDFPKFTLHASMIKKLDSKERILRGLETYDRVVVPMDRNDDDEFLESLTHKDRIVLFGNAGCAYTCPSRTCYVGISQDNQSRPITGHCSQTTVARQSLGHVLFDINKFVDMGYRHFKLIPSPFPVDAPTAAD
jgi:hypothetical protein